MGLAVVEKFKECSISSLGTPGMSTGFHANTSTCSHRKLTSVSSYLGSRSALIQAVLDWSSGTRTTSLNSLDLVEAQATSRIGISRSSGGITSEVMMQSYIQMDVSCLSKRETFLLASIGDIEVSLRREDALLHQHLHH